jgi:hypothetical protein
VLGGKFTQAAGRPLAVARTLAHIPQFFCILLIFFGFFGRVGGRAAFAVDFDKLLS